MATFRLTIRCDGAAFESDGDEDLRPTDQAARAREVARIMREFAADIDIEDHTAGKLRDINGNTCGEWSITGK